MADVIAPGVRVRLTGADKKVGGSYAYADFVGREGTVTSRWVLGVGHVGGPFEAWWVTLDMPDGRPLSQAVEVRHLEVVAGG